MTRRQIILKYPSSDERILNMSSARSWLNICTYVPVEEILRRDNTMNDIDAYVVFVQQEEAVSQTEVAKFQDTECYFPGRSGETSDEVSVNTQIKLEGFEKLMKLTDTKFPTVWIRLLLNRR